VLKVGDAVVTMSYPGLFTVVAIDGDHVTIADAAGRTTVVRESNVRRVRTPA
jgi:preprotein translocase subunit YajC